MTSPEDDLPYEAIQLLEQGKRQQAVFAVRKALRIDLTAALARVERWERNHPAILPRGLELVTLGEAFIGVAMLLFALGLLAAWYWQFILR